MFHVELFFYIIKMKISGNIFDVINKEIYKGSIIIKRGLIEDIVREDNESDIYIMPGLVDSHVHIESSMLVPSAFAVAAVRHGTVTVVSDPHEIANVMGIEGVDFMIQNAKEVPLKFYFGAPSCVPATDLESSGAVLDVSDIKELLSRREVKYLSEMMNFPGVIGNDTKVIAKINAARERGKPVDGHAPGLTGDKLKKYINAGISTDHECINIEEAREKIRSGMMVQIREGSAARSLDSFHYLLAEEPDMLMLCSDDLHPEMLNRGHINVLVERLMAMGYDIMDIMKIVTVNPVKHYGLETGLLRKGDPADFIIIDNTHTFNIRETWIDGVKVYDGKRVLFSPEKVEPINNFHSSHIKPEDIAVRRTGDNIRVIKAVDGELITGSYEWDVSGLGEYVNCDPAEDILKIVVKDRYKDLPPATAFVRGFGISRGAFASSVAHDSHNIIAVGADDDSICRAINRIVDEKGGLVVYYDDICQSLPLKVAGIMSDVPCGTIANQYEELSEIVKNMGCQLKSPFMTLSFMALLVIPDLKISDKGLFDVNKFELVDLFF